MAAEGGKHRIKYSEYMKSLSNDIIIEGVFQILSVCLSAMLLWPFSSTDNTWQIAQQTIAFSFKHKH